MYVTEIFITSFDFRKFSFPFFQATFRSMEIEDMYLKYCMQMKRPLIIILLIIVLIVCLSIIILHIAEDKVHVTYIFLIFSRSYSYCQS